MKLYEYQDLQRQATSHHVTSAERRSAEAKLQGARLTGVVYRPVFFGNGGSKGDFVGLVARALQLRKSAAKNAIAEATVECDGGVIAYTNSTIAGCAGEDRVGMGSCADFRVVEADPEHAWGADISTTSGRGWRHI